MDSRRVSPTVTGTGPAGPGWRGYRQCRRGRRPEKRPERHVGAGQPGRRQLGPPSRLPGGPGLLQARTRTAAQAHSDMAVWHSRDRTLMVPGPGPYRDPARPGSPSHRRLGGRRPLGRRRRRPGGRTVLPQCLQRGSRAVSSESPGVSHAQ